MILHYKNRTFGGEQELYSDGLFYGITNSGRSSLRWLIQSMDLINKKILVPDFVCQIVIDILLEYQVKIIFYTIKDDFEFSLKENIFNADAIYLVKYFGHTSDAFKTIISTSSIPLIVDDVFGIQAPKITSNVPWGYFNSLRKITPIADFSQVITNIPLLDITKKRLLEFSTLKYKAKEIKFDFVNSSAYDEEKFLRLFEQAEYILNTNKGIFQPEDKSIFLAGKLHERYEVNKTLRLQNMDEAKKNIPSKKQINITPEFPSFLPVLLNHRDRVRSMLMKKGVFLAIHWPSHNKVKNAISDKIISIPLDPRYDRNDIRSICNLINQFDN